MAALTAVVLAGGASLGAGVAAAAPAAPPAPPPTCTIGKVAYVLPTTPKPGVPRAKADPRTKACVDSVITDHVLKPTEAKRYRLVLAPPKPSAPKPTPAPASPAPKPAPASPAPKPAPASPVTTPPVTTPPVTTTPANADPTKADPTRAATSPAARPTSPSTAPALAPSAGGTSASVARVAAVPAPGPAAAPAGPLAPGPVPSIGGAATGGGLAIADAPSAAPVPVDQVVAAVDPASYLDPLGAPGTAALPGDGTVLQTLGGDTAGVTTSSRVSALGLDGLHRSGGVPAVLGVVIMSGLAGFALRHRVLAGIRRAAVVGGPDPDGVPDVPEGPEGPTEIDAPRGRHAR